MEQSDWLMVVAVVADAIIILGVCYWRGMTFHRLTDIAVESALSLWRTLFKKSDR